MGKVIVIHNQKGGVGKTSITYGLAHELAPRGYKTLAIDCDGQANLTSDILSSDQHGSVKRSIADAMIAYAKGSGSSMPIISVTTNLDVVPSSGNISGIDIALSRASNPSSVFKSLLTSIVNKYDIIMVDLAPSAGLLALNVLSIADFILIPSLLDDNSYRGAIKVLKFVKTYIPAIRTSSEHVGIVINQYSLLSRLTKSVNANFDKSLSPWIFSTKIRRNVAIGMAMRQHISFSELDSKCNAACDIRSLGDELISKLDIIQSGPIHLHAGDEVNITKSGIKIKHHHEQKTNVSRT